MPADVANLRYYADESILGVGKALTMVRRDLIHPGHSLIPEIPLGALDTDWMPVVAARGLAVIARDRRIRTKPGELTILRNHGLRVFWISGRRDLTSWGYLVRLVNRWSDMEEQLAMRGPGPWFMAINERDITDIPLPP